MFTRLEVAERNFASVFPCSIYGMVIPIVDLSSQSFILKTNTWNTFVNVCQLVEKLPCLTNNIAVILQHCAT